MTKQKSEDDSLQIALKEIKSMNVHQKINGVMSELSYLKKNGNIGYGNNSYTAITHDHVTKSLQPLIVKYRLTAIPEMTDTKIERYQVTTRKGDLVDRYETTTTVKLVVTNIDSLGEVVETTASSHGFDSQDKSCGKAYSMATKYCYLKMFMIASGDEEESRVETARVISAEKHELETQLKELLKANDKLNDKAIAYMSTLDIDGLRAAIDKYKQGVEK